MQELHIAVQGFYVFGKFKSILELGGIEMQFFNDLACRVKRYIDLTGETVKVRAVVL